MKLIVIANPVCFNGEMLLVNRLLEAGMEVFHLRKPELSRPEYSRVLKEVDPGFRDRIALHQFHELAEEFHTVRLHYPENMRKAVPKTADFKHRESAVLSTSVHDLNELDCLAGFDYTFFSPVFNSISKPGYHSVLKPGFKLPESKIEVIALGGVDENNIAMAKAIRFDGVALLGVLWKDPAQALTTFKTIQQQCQQADHV